MHFPKSRRKRKAKRNGEGTRQKFLIERARVVAGQEQLSFDLSHVAGVQVAQAETHSHHSWGRLVCLEHLPRDGGLAIHGRDPDGDGAEGRRSEGLGGRLLYFRAPLFGNLPAFRCLTDNPRVLPIHGASPEWKSRPRLRVTPVPPRTTGRHHSVPSQLGTQGSVSRPGFPGPGIHARYVPRRRAIQVPPIPSPTTPPTYLE